MVGYLHHPLRLSAHSGRSLLENSSLNKASKECKRMGYREREREKPLTWYDLVNKRSMPCALASGYGPKWGCRPTMGLYSTRRRQPTITNVYHPCPEKKQGTICQWHTFHGRTHLPSVPGDFDKKVGQMGISWVTTAATEPGVFSRSPTSNRADQVKPGSCRSEDRLLKLLKQIAYQTTKHLGNTFEDDHFWWEIR